MEDILASIRRIIADDQSQSNRSGYGGLRRGQGANGGSRSPVENDADQSRRPEHRSRFDDVLDLARLPGTAVPESFASPPEPAEALGATDAPHEESPLASPAVGDHAQAHAGDHPAFTSPPESHLETEEKAASNETDDHDLPDHDTEFQELSSVSFAGESESGEGLISPMLGASVMSAFETLAATVVLQNTEMLERVMHELLRPLLKNWLDENLPTLVERLVRTEIERVARGGRR